EDAVEQRVPHPPHLPEGSGGDEAEVLVAARERRRRAPRGGRGAPRVGRDDGAPRVGRDDGGLQRRLVAASLRLVSVPSHEVPLALLGAAYQRRFVLGTAHRPGRIGSLSRPLHARRGRMNDASTLDTRSTATVAEPPDNQLTAFLIAWSATEPHRVGEVAI